jgi:ABC-type glycerol-3-phosphate transport system substrate-binding protein
LYETPIFAKRGWLQPIEGLSSDYDLDDVFKSLRDGLSYEGKLYALPFYGESSFLMYRKDLFEQKGLKMPDQPTYDDIAKFAAALNDKAGGVLLRGLEGRLPVHINPRRAKAVGHGVARHRPSWPTRLGGKHGHRRKNALTA